MRFLKIAVISILAVVVMAADAPKKDDLVELSGWLNARSDSKFRKVDTNTLFTLAKGTRGSIEQIKHFPATKNYGVCIRVLSGSRVDKPNRCVWVYFNPKQPNLKLFSVGGNEASRNAKLAEWAVDPKKAPSVEEARSPDAANAAEANRDIPAIIEPPASSAQGTDSGKPIDPNLYAQTSIGVLDQLNQNAPLGRDPLDANSGCPDGNCVMKLANYEQCTKENNYLENKIADISKRDPMASVLAMQSNDMINKSCVQKAMEIFPPSKNFYRSDACVFSKKVPRPCVSENYVDVTAKSFNLVAKCMAPILAGSTDLQDQKQAAYSVFSLMTTESGLHTNATSGTGAGGVAQLTKPAIQDVNNNIERYKEALKTSSNPLCSKNLASVLDDPIPSSRPTASLRSCNRISMDKNHPLKSMMYGFAFQNIVKDFLQNSVFDRFTGVFSALPSALLESLKLKLAMWGHNAGAGGVAHPAEQVLTQMRRNNKRLQTAQDVDKFMSELETTMLNSPSTGNRRGGRPKETSSYYPNIVARMRALEPAGGQTCIAP